MGDAANRLDEHAGAELLRIARDAVTACVRGENRPALHPAHEALLQPGAAFVSLHLRDDERTLRGCIGTLSPDRPLARVVQDVATSAASRDPRFPAIEAGELDELEVEVTVLAAPEPVRGPEDIRIGEHGLLIERGAARGVLLPQVAVEHDWSAEQFLAHTCRKAGLPTEAWREAETRIQAFEAQVFRER